MLPGLEPRRILEDENQELRYLNHLDKQKIDIDLLLLTNISKSIQVSDELKLADAEICRLMDVASGYLISKLLICLGGVPDFRCLSSKQGGPVISMTY